MASSFSSSPVTELTSGRPLATLSAASIAAVTELSIDKRHVDQALDDLERLDEQGRLGFVRVDRGDTGIDVEHGGACCHLLQRILDDGVEIADDHLGGQLLAAGRVDALTDDAEGLVEADDDFAGGGGDDGAGHEV
jgi:hypothetical protein